MTRAARFTQADLTRAVLAMRKAGECVTGAEIKPDGSIVVMVGSEQVNEDWRAGSPLYAVRA
jgi:hypothetical protein